MVEPVAENAAQQIRAPEKWAVTGGRGAEREVVAAAGASMTTIQLELLCAEPARARILVQFGGDPHEFWPIASRMNIHLDDARIRRDRKSVDSVIRRRCVALDYYWCVEMGSCVLNGPQQVDVVF